MLVGTFGKAFGTFGAFVAGDADLIDFLIQKSRTYIYTTALPPALAAATRAALEVSQRESWRREKVLALAQRAAAARCPKFSRTHRPGTALHRHPAGGSRRRRSARWPRAERSKARVSSSPRSVRRRCPRAPRACASRCPRRTKKRRWTALIAALARGARRMNSPDPRAGFLARSPRGVAGVRSRQRQLRRGGRAAGTRAQRAPRPARGTEGRRRRPSSISAPAPATRRARSSARYPARHRRRRRHRAGHAGAREGAVALAAPLRTRARRCLFAAVSRCVASISSTAA